MLRRSFVCLFQSAPDPTPHVTRFIEESRKRSQARTLDPKQVEKNQRIIDGLLKAREELSTGTGVATPLSPKELDELFDAVEQTVSKSENTCAAVSTPETRFGC